MAARLAASAQAERPGKYQGKYQANIRDTHNPDFSYSRISTSLTPSGSRVRNTGA